jgi:hypothetical protein
VPKEARARQTKLNNEGRYVTINLPEICLYVHMYSTGSGPDLGEEEYNYWKETLQIALDNWKEERLDDKLFDDAVKNLIQATLDETKGIKYD